jgi:CPA1 family monovalent cation:H+ antiporter
MVLLLALLPFAAYMLGERIGVSGFWPRWPRASPPTWPTCAAAVRRRAHADPGPVDHDRNRIQRRHLPAAGPAAARHHRHHAEPGRRSLVAAALQVLLINVALLGFRWIWLTLGVRGSLMRARGRRMAERPSPLLTLATTLAGIRGAITLAGALSVPLLLPGGAPFPAASS